MLTAEVCDATKLKSITTAGYQKKKLIEKRPAINHLIKGINGRPTSPIKLQKTMDIQNTQSQMRKGVLEFCILSVIRQGEVYPSDIVDKMTAANLNIFEGTLYPLLTRLKNAEYLTYRWVESNSGPPRKYFVMTEKGLAFYAELEKTWKELADAVELLTRPVTPSEDNNQQL